MQKNKDYLGTCVLSIIPPVFICDTISATIENDDIDFMVARRFPNNTNRDEIREAMRNLADFFELEIINL